MVALERGRPSESRRPGEPARLRERVERMGRGLSPRTRRALRTGVSRSDVERRRRSGTARARIAGLSPADVRRALFRPLRGIHGAAAHPYRVPRDVRTPARRGRSRGEPGARAQPGRRTRAWSRWWSVCATTRTVPASRPRTELDPAGHAGATPGTMRRPRQRARLLPPHPQDRGRDRHHVPRRGLPLRADLSRHRLGRPARAAGREPVRLPTLPWSLRCDASRAAPETSAGRDDAARSGRARAVGVAVRAPASGPPLLRRSAPSRARA